MDMSKGQTNIEESVFLFSGIILVILFLLLLSLLLFLGIIVLFKSPELRKKSL